MSRGSPTYSVVRQAVVGDVENIVSLVNSAYRGEGAKEGWTTEADLLGGQRVDAERIREILLHPDQCLLLWAENERTPPIACVLLERRDERAYLGMLTVQPKLQNVGLGRQILDYAELWVKREWASRSIEMTVISIRHELIEWYERRGYQKTNERRPFQMHDPRFGLPKVDFLEFVVLEKELAPST